MNEKELIDFLKSNLTVRVTTDYDGDINVSLILCGEEISKDWTSLPKA